MPDPAPPATDLLVDLQPAPEPDRSQAGADWRLIVLLGGLTAFGPMTIDMYLPALPAITADLRSTAEAGQATLAVFFAGLAAGQLVYGPASDRLGRRPAILFGTAVYVAASLLCAFAVTMPMLLGARLLQALGGCAGIVVARAVVRDRFDHQRSAHVFSQLSLVMGLAPILAPLAGGALLQAAGWRPIFGVLAGFGALMGLWTLFGLKESRSAASAAQARSERPHRAYLALLRNRRFLGYLLAGALNGAVLFSYISSSASLLMGTYGVGAAAFGWYFGANAVGVIGGTQVSRLLLLRRSSDQVLVLMSTVALAAAVLLALAVFAGPAGGAGKWLVLPLLWGVLASYGVMQANTAAGALSLEPLRAGSASALTGAASFAMGAAAAALAGVFHDGTARPLAVTVLVLLALSWAALRLLALPRPRARLTI